MASFMVPAAGGTAAVLAGILVNGGGSGLSSALALTVVGTIGNVLAGFLVLIPIWSFVIPIVKEKGVGNRTVYGHLLMMLGGVSWGLYAAPTWHKSWVSGIINALCALFQLIYVVVFIVYASGKKRWIAAGLLLVAVVGSGFLAWCVFIKVIATGEWDKSFIATVASIVSCLSYAAVGVDIAVVATSKDVNNMDPLAEVLLNLLNAVAWVYYAYLSEPVDNYIGVSNVVGVVFLLVQLIVFVVHCRAKAEPEPKPESPDFGLELLFGPRSPQVDLPVPESPDFGLELLFSPQVDVLEPEIPALVENKAKIRPL